jgi:glycosyltransferase involved in cell wall biosynthesis
MTGRVAFYAPLKSPNHPIPSGDREIARLMMRALQQAGYDVELVSEIISYQKRPSRELYDTRRSALRIEEKRLGDLWEKTPEIRPDLWFTYHPYCKSPDWLGPPLCKRFDIPYVTAEACRTHQGSDEDWLAGRAAVQEAVRQAAANFVLKDSDWRYLETFLPKMESALRVPPFIAVADQPEKSTSGNLATFPRKSPILFAAGMMRPGAKAESYRLLSDALRLLDNQSWNLIIAGEGPERPAIEASFDFLPPDRVKFLGSVEHTDMFALMDLSDLFVWPGVGEAIGLVYLEAQSRALPVVAMETAGVPLVVSDNIGGLLTPAGDLPAYRTAIGRLLADPVLLGKLAAGGQAYVSQRHDVTAVAATFHSALDGILAAFRTDQTSG